MIELIFENDCFLVIHKTAAANFHSENGELGLFEQVKLQLKKDILYPVHRLDKATTGLMVFAKTQQCAADFGGIFSCRTIDKYYLAITNNKPKKKQGWVKGDMAKARRGAYKLLRSQQNPAITRFTSIPLAQGARLFLIKPYTGKTHQIRVALKSLGSPILGDVLYGGAPTQRMHLHAYALKFYYQDKLYQFVQPPKTELDPHSVTTASPVLGFHQGLATEQINQQWCEPWIIFEGKQ